MLLIEKSDHIEAIDLNGNSTTKFSISLNVANPPPISRLTIMAIILETNNPIIILYVLVTLLPLNTNSVVIINVSIAIPKVVQCSRDKVFPSVIVASNPNHVIEYATKEIPRIIMIGPTITGVKIFFNGS